MVYYIQKITMSDKAKTKPPEVELANKEWVLMELKDTENRIEKAFHDQTQYLTAQLASIDAKLGSQISAVETKVADQKSETSNVVRWVVGIGIAIVLAVIIRPTLG